MNNHKITEHPSSQPIIDQTSIIPAKKAAADVVDQASLHLSKKTIQRKTILIGFLTGLSRVLGIVRETLLIRYFGLGTVSDSFIAAFRIPNLFRHVFAEGATNASFVPVMVKTVKEDGKEVASGLMSLALLTFQGVILLMYLGLLLKTTMIVKFVAPGFSAEHIAQTSYFLRILFPFLFLASGSALLSGALNSVNHFLIPAAGPALWNTIYVLSLIACIYYNLSTDYLCWGILLGGFAQLVAHLWVYFHYKFTFNRILPASRKAFGEVMSKFFPFLLGVSIVELNLFVGGQIASFLPKGSVSILYYGSRYMNLPIGILGVAFASVLLPHFSRMVLYAPKRINFYLLEATKFITLLVLPASIFLMLVSQQLYTDMLGIKGTTELISQASLVLIIYCVGLVFFCINKSLLNIFYSLKDTRSATIISSCGALVNVGGDLIGMYWWGIYGIAAACSASGIAMTILCIRLLNKKHGYRFNFANFGMFMSKYCAQLFIIGGLLTWLGITALNYADQAYPQFHSFTFWTIAVITGLSTIIGLWLTRKLFRLNVYFLK